MTASSCRRTYRCPTRRWGFTPMSLTMVLSVGCSTSHGPSACRSSEGPAQVVALVPVGHPPVTTKVYGGGSGTITVVLPSRRDPVEVHLDKSGSLALDQPVPKFMHLVHSGTTVITATDSAGHSYRSTVEVHCG